MTKPIRISVLVLAVQFVLGMSLPMFAQQSVDSESSKFEIKEVEAVKALVIKSDVTMQEIGSAMGSNYGKLFEYLQNNNIQPAGPPFSVYLSWEEGGNVVFESGIPVSEVKEGNDEIMYKEFPGMKVLSTLYKGSYDKMEPIYHEMMDYMKTNNMEGTNSSWEIYLTDPQTIAPEDNQTLIYFPLK